MRSRLRHLKALLERRRPCAQDDRDRGMPPYKGRLTDEQIRDVAAYVAQAAGA